MVEDGYEKSGEARQQIQQHQEQNQQEEQDEQPGDLSESVEVDGKRLEARRLRREY